jgi:hypothetical protein
MLVETIGSAVTVLLAVACAITGDFTLTPLSDADISGHQSG